MNLILFHFTFYITLLKFPIFLFFFLQFNPPREFRYYSAGTCEMMVDKNNAHFFLELNARLQVEHPVSEEVTGVDLVEQMIR